MSSISENIWFNGKIVSKEEGKVYCFNQAMTYGASIYEGIRIYETKEGPCFFRLDEHIDRYFYSASVFRMNLNFTKEELKQAIITLAKENNITSGYVRPFSFFSDTKMGINILGAEVTTVIVSWPWKEDVIPIKPVSVKISKYEKMSEKNIDVKAKISGYYANGLLAFIEAREAGFDLPLLLDYKGNIAEGAMNNIFFVKNGKLVTPGLENVLSGITRDTIIAFAKDINIEVEERDVALDELGGFDEAFLTGTGVQLQKISRIDDLFTAKSVKVTAKIQEYYGKVAHGEIEKYKKWLAPVS